MHVVPYRVSGAAAGERQGERLFQIGQHAITVQQQHSASGSLRTTSSAVEAHDAIEHVPVPGESDPRAL